MSAISFTFSIAVSISRFSFGSEFDLCGSALTRVVDNTLPIGDSLLFEQVEVITNLHNVCGFHRWTGFDVVENPVFVDESRFSQDCQCPILCVFRAE